MQAHGQTGTVFLKVYRISVNIHQVGQVRQQTFVCLCTWMAACRCTY